MNDIRPAGQRANDLRADDRPSGSIPTSRPIVPILPEGEAILQPPMDNTPNEAPDTEPPARIPHLGHALLFLSIAAVLLLLLQLILLGVTHNLPKIGALPPSQPIGTSHTTDNIPPKLLIIAEALSYIATLGVSWFIFPFFWHKSFAAGLQLNGAAATRNALRLIPIGITVSFIVLAISSLITTPKAIPIDEFFRTPGDAWLVSAFGILLAPLFEEILFRGFLLPGFAIAYDWLSLPRIPAAREQWNSTNTLTFPALVFSAVLTSILFALMHAVQTGFTWPVLVLLFLVSLLLTAVRLRLRSVLASTLVHASYNFAIFLSLFIATGGFRHLDHLIH
jgi:membrane protease YdiL (CAAX protease family)